MAAVNERRIRNAQMLNEGVEKIHSLTPPYVDAHVKHVFHQYVVKVEEDYPLGRNELADHLKTVGIGATVHYPIPIYRQPAYQKSGYDKMTCPVTEDSCKRVLSLPVHPSVAEEDVTYVLNALKAVS